ncbi:MAG: peptide deformylase [Verrucomicrobiota bacterium]
MILPIVYYGKPVLREKGARVEEVTEEIRRLAADMLETMRDADGIGLAAQQIGQAIQLAIVDVSHDPECFTVFRVDGEEASLEDWMPLTFLNPEIEGGKLRESENEGCLSFPEIQGGVRRPTTIRAQLTLLDGRVIQVEADGLLARAIQHETDHLNGILFIDRMSSATKVKLRRRIKELKRENS